MDEPIIINRAGFKKNHTPVIVLSIIICILIGIIVWGLFNQSRADKKYRQLLENNRQLNLRHRSTNEAFERTNRELAERKLRMGKIISSITERLQRAGKIIEKLTGIESGVRTDIEGAREGIRGIREILIEVMAGDN